MRRPNLFTLAAVSASILALTSLPALAATPPGGHMGGMGGHMGGHMGWPGGGMGGRMGGPGGRMGGRMGPGGGMGRMGSMEDQMNLTPAQQAKAQALQASVRSQMMALQANRSLSQAQKSEKMMSIGRNAQTSFLKILTPAQRVKYQKIRKQQMAEQAKMMQERMKNMTPQQRAMMQKFMHQMQGGH